MAAIESKQVIGLPVLGIAEGAQLGKIRDVLVDAPDKRVVGFVVEPGGGERDDQLLLTEEIRAVGADAVTVADRTHLRPLAAQASVKALAEQQMPIKGKTVVSEDGKRLGHVDEFTFDPQQFTICEYFVFPSGIGGLFLTGAPRRLTADAVVSVGPDAVVVRAGQGEVVPQPGLG